MTARYLHTMVRVTDPAKSRAFYEALGMEFRRESPIVRTGETEATLYFFRVPETQGGGAFELTFNHDGSTYDLGTAYGNHIAIGVDDLDATLARLAEQGIEPERAPYQVREGGSFLCFVRDPDGYRIEIIGRGGGLARWRGLETARRRCLTGRPSTICEPPGPQMTSFRKTTPSARRRSTSPAMSSTSKWIRFHPPGPGRRPSEHPAGRPSSSARSQQEP